MVEKVVSASAGMSTIVVGGDVVKVTFEGHPVNYVFIRHVSGEVLVSRSPNIADGVDGTVKLSAGGYRFDVSAPVVYISGSGVCEVSASALGDFPFKVSGKGGETPDLSVYALKSKYGDTTIDVGRKADTKKGSHSTAEGYNATASGECSHAEGHSTTTSGNYSHAEGRSTTASGADSHAEGQSTTASGADSHAEGVVTTASGECSHAEGKNTTASGLASHAGGTGTKALHDNEVAYGKFNESKDGTLFSVGDGTSDSARHNAFEITTTGGKLHDKDIATADLIPTELPANGGNADTARQVIGSSSKIKLYEDNEGGNLRLVSPDGIHYMEMDLYNNEGFRMYFGGGDELIFPFTYDFATKKLSINGYTVDADVPADVDFSAYALKSKYGDTTIDVGRKADTTIGAYSTAEGQSTTASGNYSHAEGYMATASGSHSHAEGSYVTASGVKSHAEGGSTTSSGEYSHAEGAFTIADNKCSHAGGHYSADMTTGGSIVNSVGTAFIIGNGTSGTAKSNAFSVMFNGTVKAKSTITASTTADYAEFFEWLDGNPNEEDRVGYFVTMDGDKIKIANPDDEYILGIVSGEPFVLGNGDCDTWNGMFLRDEFRRTVYEPAPKIEEILDDEGNPTGEFEEIKGEFEGTRPKLNPEYDHTKTYTSRFDRPEWSPVGMLGVLAVRHDGTAKVNGYVTVADGGIATACDRNAENSYRVIKANSDSVVEVIFR